MTIGIYKIENMIDHKKYIGQSRNIEKRWQRHKSTAFCETDKAYDTHLYRAIRKYGLNNFNFSIIEECSTDKLNEREKFWIAYYNSFEQGYNLTLGGDAGSLVKEKETILGIYKDLEQNLLTQKEIAKKWQVSEEMVQGMNTGRYWYNSNRDYPIRKKPVFHKISTTIINPELKCKRCGKIIASKKANYCIECAQLLSRKSERPSREELKKMIRNIPFTTIANKFGVSDNAIRKWCKAEKLPSKAKDIKSYSDEEWDKI